MLEPLSPLTLLQQSLADGSTSPARIADQALARANGNASRNTYLWLEQDHLSRQAEALQKVSTRPPLWGVPISLKDCFDLAGAPTTCGSRFYAERGPIAHDSALSASLRNAGALVTGKTHLHPLAYGITGENPEYGDCLQPRDATLLTGGSSSGAAASVQEGSVLAAIGTDTGGSIRVPAALCGLVGYRASQGLAALWWPQVWQGAMHLAPSFDTVGLLLRDPRDAAPIARALFGVPAGPAPCSPRIGCMPLSFLEDCESDVLAAYATWQQEFVAIGAQVFEIEPAEPSPVEGPLLRTVKPGEDLTGWDRAVEIFTGIQANEAAQLHAGHYDRFESSIRDRLRWGASLTSEELVSLHLQMESFREAMRGLLKSFDLLLLPCAPVSRLTAGADHSTVRKRILRYTAPFSLAGLPALSLPGEMLGAPRGTGVQLAAARGADPMLLAYAETIGQSIASRL